jgi:hypothetical protein
MSKTDYKTTFNEWRKSLSPEEQAQIRSIAKENNFKGDIFEPIDEFAKGSSTGFDHDASADAVFIESPNLITDQFNHDALEFCERALLAVKESQNARRAVDEIYFAFGFHVGMGETCTSLAKRYGISKAAFSKNARATCKRYGIRPSGLMKTEQAVERYRVTNRPRGKN